MRISGSFISTILTMLLVFCLSPVISGAPAFAAKKIWEDGDSRLDLFGDMRLRFEKDDDERAGKADRDRTRGRVRLRFGANYKASDVVSMGFRLRTASSNRQSPHQTLGLYGKSGSNSDFGVDRAFFRLSGGGAYLWGGKNAFPAWNPAEFLWDDDLQPEGLAAGWGGSFGIVKVKLNAGYFVIGEGNWDDDDMLLSYQGMIKAGDSFQVRAAVGGLSFDDGDENSATAASGQLPGGTATITHAMVEVRSSDLPLEPRVGVLYSTSDVDDDKIGSGAESADKKALVAYVRGSVSGVDLRFYYWDNGYAAQPLLGSLGQDNFPFSSNYKGYHIQVGYKFFGNLSTDLRYYWQETKNENITVHDSDIAMQGDRTRTRIQLNLNVKF